MSRCVPSELMGTFSILSHMQNRKNHIFDKD